MFVLISNNTILDASYSYHFLYKADILYSSFDTRGGKTDHFRVSNNRTMYMYFILLIFDFVRPNQKESLTFDLLLAKIQM